MTTPPSLPITRPRRRWRFWLALASILIGLNFIVGVGVWTWWLWQQLPTVSALQNWHPEEPLRIYADNGQLLQVIGPQIRYALPLREIPQQVQEAFVAAENAHFYSHNPFYYPVSYPGIVRAAFVDLIHMAPVEGASTITEQVARNFYLTPQKTITRKVAEILLAYKLAARLTRSQILDLYLNKIYLGQGAYGVQAAAHTYYGKNLNRLTLADIAMLAGLPAAPSIFNPIKNPKLARRRRDYVLHRMAVRGYITHRALITAEAQPVRTDYHAPANNIAPYATDWIRQWLAKRFGPDFTYRRGLRVYTTINPRDQRAADHSMAVGLENYAMGLDSLDPHTWRGPVARLHGMALRRAAAGHRPARLPAHDPANLRWGVVLRSGPRHARVALEGRRRVILGVRDVAWARHTPTAVNQVLQRGDLIWLRPYVVASSVGTGNPVWGARVWHDVPHPGWELTQIPQVQGALVSLDSHSGAILALTGGFSYELSHFDRALYAYRQPGSGFKPFVYAAAMDGAAMKAAGNRHYLTPVSLIKDTPLAVRLPDGRIYRPTNYSNTFSKTPFPVWEDLADSHNVPSVRLLLHIGIPYAAAYVHRMGFPLKQIPQVPSMVLGSGDFTPMQMVRGYATFSSGGFLPTPYLVSRIQTAAGRRMSLHECPLGYAPPPPGTATAIPPGVAFLLTRMMERVIRSGTGIAAQILHRRDLAGKTGTTNTENNAWFSGYNPKVVTTVWVGYDNNKSMGHWAAGAREALPIWIHYMKTALRGQANLRFPRPLNIVRARYNPKTGTLTDSRHAGRKGYFLAGYLPPHAPKTFPAITHLVHAFMGIF
ncbi:MAG: penicillin-binding protein 1A [Acidiferrobacter sp.]